MRVTMRQDLTGRTLEPGRGKCLYWSEAQALKMNVRGAHPRKLARRCVETPGPLSRRCCATLPDPALDLNRVMDVFTEGRTKTHKDNTTTFLSR
jgi:hypothetical protein